MNTIKKICFILLLPCSITFAQTEVDIFGYFESQFMGAQIDNNFFQMHTNKLRIDLEGSFSDNVVFGANFDYITYHGYTKWNILDYLPKPAAEEAQILNFMGAQINPYIMQFKDRHFLDNAYIKFTSKSFDLTLGKQQISLGTGYAWNPLDIYNTKDLLDPTYEQPGHNAVRFDLPLSLMSNLTLLYSPGSDFESSGGFLQFKSSISHFDFSILAGQRMWNFHDYTKFNMDIMNPDFFEAGEKRQIAGFSTTGELFGLGVWAEYGCNWMESSDDFEELVVGADYTFTSGTYVMAEFYRNTMGKTNKAAYRLNDWMRFFSQEQKSIARDQVYGFIQHPAGDLISLGLSSIYTVTDQSLALLPTLNWNAFENVEIIAYLNFYIGEAGAVYNEKMGNGGLVRARVYF